MTTSRATRWAAGAAVALLAVTLVAAPVTASPRQDGPTAVIPPLPDDLDALTAGLSPVLWQACNGVGLAVGLIVLAGTLAGVPPEVGVPLNEAIATASGPVLLAFFEVCQQIPLPEAPPDCETDLLLPLLPSLGRPVLPAALLASELRALGTALEGAGLPLQGALGDAADDLLACAAGTDPEPDPPTAEPEPGADPGDGTVGGDGGSSLGGGAGPAAAGGAGVLPPIAGSAGGATASGSPLAAAQPARASDGGTGTGLAMALLGATALAGAGWVHAGRARPERAAPSPAPAS